MWEMLEMGPNPASFILLDLAGTKLKSHRPCTKLSDNLQGKVKGPELLRREDRTYRVIRTEG